MVELLGAHVSPVALALQAVAVCILTVLVVVAMALRRHGTTALVAPTLAACVWVLIFDAWFFGLHTSLFAGLTIIASIAVGYVLFERRHMHAAVVAMGFPPTVRIVKTRRSGSWGEVSLCLDEVEHAGTFLELELLTNDDPTQVQQQLAERIRTLGIEGVQVTDTYDTLVRDALRV